MSDACLVSYAITAVVRLFHACGLPSSMETKSECIFGYGFIRNWVRGRSENDFRKGKLEIRQFQVYKTSSYAVGFVSRKRPFWAEAQIELFYTVEKELFRLSDLTCGSSRKRVFEPIASLIPPQTTHPHTHTPIPNNWYHTAVSYNSADAAVTTAAASRFSPHVRVVHSEFHPPAACIIRWQQRAVSMPFCQQQLHLL